MNTEVVKRVEQAIKDIKQGKMVIMVDDEDRENEGDLVFAATFSTPELVNFMAKEARGLICTPLNRTTAEKLKLFPMIDTNTSNHTTAFTVSIDSVTAKTGISAIERNDCILKLSLPTTQHNDFVRPGHIFPLVAKDGGVLVRTGHTEGSVDLCRLAGVAPIAVICEIIKDDGEMARKEDLKTFASTHSLNIVYISDIVEYRLSHEKLVHKTEETEGILKGTKITKITYIDHLKRKHIVIQFYKTHETSNVKFHNIGVDRDLILDDRRTEVLNNSINYLKKNGGILIFLDTKSVSQEQAKEFGIGAQILKELGIEKINLLTTNQETEFIGIQGFGLEVLEKVLV
jgi:3,4-dihydroxy 2-butanone 4-phosphate synthase/GTP cyclohydrolase II